jgi:hypothetical protein
MADSIPDRTSPVAFLLASLRSSIALRRSSVTRSRLSCSVVSISIFRTSIGGVLFYRSRVGSRRLRIGASRLLSGCCRGLCRPGGLRDQRSWRWPHRGFVPPLRVALQHWIPSRNAGSAERIRLVRPLASRTRRPTSHRAVARHETPSLSDVRRGGFQDHPSLAIEPIHMCLPPTTCRWLTNVGTGSLPIAFGSPWPRGWGASSTISPRWPPRRVGALRRWRMRCARLERLLLPEGAGGSPSPGPNPISCRVVCSSRSAVGEAGRGLTCPSRVTAQRTTRLQEERHGRAHNQESRGRATD